MFKYDKQAFAVSDALFLPYSISKSKIALTVSYVIICNVKK